MARSSAPVCSHGNAYRAQARHGQFCGSAKSWVAERLAASAGLTRVNLNHIFREPGGYYVRGKNWQASTLLAEAIGFVLPDGVCPPSYPRRLYATGRHRHLQKAPLLRLRELLVIWSEFAHDGKPGRRWGMRITASSLHKNGYAKLSITIPLNLKPRVRAGLDRGAAARRAIRLARGVDRHTAPPRKRDR